MAIIIINTVIFLFYLEVIPVVLITIQTNIVYINSVAGKKPDIFPNPEVFDPERWARDKPHPFAHLLFGFGPRSCYGAYLSYYYTKPEVHELAPFTSV